MPGIIGAMSDDVLDCTEADLERLLRIDRDVRKGGLEQVRHLRQRC